MATERTAHDRPGASAASRRARRRCRRRPSTSCRSARPPIVQATDLGSVQVLKHGNLYLLTDAFGDIHPDCPRPRAVPRRHPPAVVLGAARRRRAAGPAPGLGRGELPRRHPADQSERRPEPRREGPPGRTTLTGRTIGISRDRLIGAEGLAERLRLVNHAGGAGQRSTLELELGADGADIFEVRGYPRPGRGTLLPVAMARPTGSRSATTAWTASSGCTHVAFTRGRRESPSRSPELPSGRRPTPARRSGCDWSVALGARRGARPGWTVWETERPAPADAARRGGRPRRGRRPVPRSAAHLGRRGRRRVPRLGARHDRRSAATTSCSTSSIKRSRRRPAAARQRRARARASATSRPACRGSRRCSAGTRSSRRSRRSRSGRRSRSRRSQVLAAYQATRGRRLARRGARQDPARAADRRDGPGRRAAAHAVLRLGRLDAAVARSCSARPSTGPATAPWSTGSGRTRWPRSTWIDRYGDRDGDGFVEYERRVRARPGEPGLEGLAATRSATGPAREAVAPIALAEVQGYVFDAKRRMAAPGAAPRRGRARRPASSARPRQLRERFEEAFWVEDQRYYAMALDGEKRPADAIGSNAGQCLWSGIVVAGPGRGRRRAAAAAGDVLGLGHPHLRAGPAGLQPDRLSHRARSGRTTRR